MPTRVMRFSAGRMPRDFGALVLATILWCPTASHAADEDPAASMFLLQGFGTLGVVHSDARDADFVGGLFQANGAGYSRAWAPGVDSRVGLQLSAKFTEPLSAIVQVVSRHLYDNTWRPQVEWAHLKYDLTPDISLRAGRSVAAPFMMSDTSLVGYTYPWIRPPPELYGELPVSNLDGVGVTYHVHGGLVEQTFSATYGQSRVKLKDGGNVSARKFLQASDAAELGPLTVRIGYTSLRATAEIPSLEALTAGFAQFGAAATMAGFAAVGTQASALGAVYSRRASAPFAFSMTTIGVSYDPGSWLLMSEWARTASDGLLESATSWYLTAGYHFGRFTPYLTVGQVESARHAAPGITATGLPPALAAGAASLNAGLDAGIKVFAPSQSSASVGMRWDAAKNIDFKFQYDRVRVDANSYGRLENTQPGFSAGPDVNAVSLAMDFVF